MNSKKPKFQISKKQPKNKREKKEKPTILLEQDEWLAALENSAWTMLALKKAFGRKNQKAVPLWINGKIKPSEKNRKRIEELLLIARQTEKIPKHESRGYITADQWEKLNSLGICQERDNLLNKIRLQNKYEGKVGFDG